jgi:hypothetical protein
MVRNQLYKILAVLLMLSVILSACQSEAPASPLSAAIKELTGTVNIKPAGSSGFVQATGDMTLQQDGSVQTGDDGRVRLDLSSGTIIRLSPSSLFTLTSNQQTDQGLVTKLKLDVGRIFIILNGGSLDVETPSGVASVRGSYMGVSVDPATLDVSITCLEGNCGGENSAGKDDISDGDKITLFHCDQTTGQCRPPELGDMTDADFEEWLKNNPEAAEILNQAHATMTALAAARPTATATPVATEAPPATEAPDAGGANVCVNILGPLDGSELPWQGPVTYAWEGHPGAKKYIVTFHYPNGLNVPFETTDTSLTRYTETMFDKGTYSWDITAIGEDGGKICQTDPASFSKPSSDPGVPPKQHDLVCTVELGTMMESPCYCGLQQNYYAPWCGG